MAEPLYSSEAPPPSASLTHEEEINIVKTVQLELYVFLQKIMIRVGGVINTFVGLFIVLALKNNVNLTYLLIWYLALCTANGLNVLCAYLNRNVTPNQPERWRGALRTRHITLSLLCLAYGWTGILYTGTDAHYQLFCITFLELLIVGFSLGTITDIIACGYCNVFLLAPYSVWSIYSLVNPTHAAGFTTSLNFSYGITLLILAIFFYMVTHIGNVLVKKFIRLNLEKTYLSEKLENANKFLEQRVKERTIRLEDSLKLVTYQATHDLLTNIPNHRLLIEHLSSTIDLAFQKRKIFAVISIYLNDIEKINDALGYQAGDHVVKIIAQRFQRYTEKMNNKNQNEFPHFIAATQKDVLVMVKPISSMENAEDEIKDIFSICNESIFTERKMLKLTTSLGVSFFPKDGSDIKTLLMNMDAAMSWAKQAGGNQIKFYTTEINENVYKNLEIENYLHHAMKNNEFELFYQPIVELRTGKIYGAEALLRWNNPILGSVPPARFVPIAEADGIILPLGEWVFQTACEQLKKWHDAKINHLNIAINLSAKQLNQKNIIQILTKILENNEIDPESIEIELTETTIFQKEFIHIVKQFKGIGLRLAIDDFGTGYSGLSNLKLFSIDKLKIDKSFIQDLATNNDSRAIVSNTIALAKELDVIILAEGVETKEQLHILQEFGCDLIQGYYFSQPISSEDFTQLLLKNTDYSDQIHHQS